MYHLIGLRRENKTSLQKFWSFILLLNLFLFFFLNFFLLLPSLLDMNFIKNACLELRDVAFGCLIFLYLGFSLKYVAERV